MQTTVNWRIYKLVQEGVLSRTGRGKFALGHQKDFAPVIPAGSKKIYSLLKKKFPYLQVCIWETSLLNEFMLHQPGRFFTIVEVEKSATESVFYYLKEMKCSVFIEPTEDILEKYLPVDGNVVIIKSLVSEAPTLIINGLQTSSLEKILVDIFCDRVIFNAYHGSEMRTIFQEALSKYCLNQTRMLRYANRRGKKDKFYQYFISITNSQNKMQ